MATDRLQQLVPVGTSVKLREVGPDSSGNRSVAEVFVAGQSINLQMVREGYAVLYPRYILSCADQKQTYLQAEQQAKTKKLNFWNQRKPKTTNISHPGCLSHKKEFPAPGSEECLGKF